MSTEGLDTGCIVGGPVLRMLVLSGQKYTVRQELPPDQRDNCNHQHSHESPFGRMAGRNADDQNRARDGTRCRHT